MKAFEFRKLSDTELRKRIQEERDNLSHLKFQSVIGQIQNPMKVSQIKKDIARMKTILRQREFEQVPQPAAPGTEKAQ
ncbi:MAG TPA: 50S ribosomal protein L29 [Terriglobia bacterium]|nr:50S ribosomal protein L29 [Terriglobia bacterium]